jgi:hypothetical protein
LQGVSMTRSDLLKSRAFPPRLEIVKVPSR